MLDENNDLLGDDEFRFFMPVTAVSKAVGDKKDGQRVVQGVASTSDKDLQGETVLQHGIDYAYFLKHGYINDDHKSGPEHKVGEPTACRMTPGGLWVKGFLYKGKQRSDFWWEHLNALEQSDSKRKVGFSIQGKIVRRNGKTIEKCWLQDVAITASPVNTSTWAEIVKSLSAEKWCIHPWKPVTKACSTCKGCMQPSDEDEEKALAATGQGAVLIPESLEGSAKVQTFKSVDRINFSEAVDILQSEKGYSRVTAKAIADSIFTYHGAH
jgi:hypothetical protein